MTTILGITDGDDAGAALLVDGRLVAAVNEERLNRMKMSIGFPHLAVAEVMRLGGVEPSQIDEVAMAAHAETVNVTSKANKGWFKEATGIARLRNDVSSILAVPLGNVRAARLAYQRVKRMTMGRRRAVVQRLLQEAGIRCPISYHDHHRCHAIASFDASGFEDALSLSLDGGGDGCSSHVYRMSQTSEERLQTLESFHSIGNYYAYVTHLCGYRASIHEGKITGLAARGEPRYKEMFARLIRYRDGEIENVGKLFYRQAIRSLRSLLPTDWEHRDLAASIQQHLEDVAIAYVSHWLERSGARNLCLSGGVFANVLLNQRLADLPNCDGVFVFPAMGDGGLAAGAVFSAWRRRPEYRPPLEAGSPIRHAYLGPEFSDAEIESALRDAGVEYRRSDEVEREIAELVHGGAVVARFHGAMEFGPRALGNRTILYKTSDPSVNAWLNERLNRTEFMPFAPACLAGQEDRLFEWNPASAKAARYMTITLKCSDWMREKCPAVVHVDGTARPQIVDPDVNPSFHKVLEHYHRLSGVPVLVNTSFNMHEEPIVCTPADAVRSYQDGRLDNLAIGSFLLGPSTHQTG